jgi:hypothetical protein
MSSMQVGFIAAAHPSCPSFPPGTPRPSWRGIKLVGRLVVERDGVDLVLRAMSRVVDRDTVAASCRLPPLQWIRSMAFWITVSVFSPRKSNFTSPACSTHFMLNWVAGMSERGSW